MRGQESTCIIRVRPPGSKEEICGWPGGEQLWEPANLQSYNCCSKYMHLHNYMLIMRRIIARVYCLSHSAPGTVSQECSHLTLNRIGKVGIAAVPLLFLVEDSEMKEVRWASRGNLAGKWCSSLWTNSLWSLSPNYKLLCLWPFTISRWKYLLGMQKWLQETYFQKHNNEIVMRRQMPEVTLQKSDRSEEDGECNSTLKVH